MLKKSLRILAQHGPAALARFAWQHIAVLLQQRQDARLDRKFGIDTCGINDDLRALGIESEHGGHAHGYEPIQIPVFERIVKTLPIKFGEYCFIDYGSGKARALILAAEAGFGRAIGVEFVPQLHAAAQRNITIYQKTRPAGTQFETYCQDAAHFSLPECAAVLFFYNPFDDMVLAKVLHEIERSWRKSPRDLIIVYRNPVYAGIFDTAGFLQPMSEEASFRLYRTRLPNK